MSDIRTNLKEETCYPKGRLAAGVILLMTMAFLMGAKYIKWPK